ncbi:MAG: hypothetical protein IJ125_00715 [Atopobiaceae bacterium]|nr:hypothetical protein [Atopobiaceae bacterium]
MTDDGATHIPGSDFMLPHNEGESQHVSRADETPSEAPTTSVPSTVDPSDSDVNAVEASAGGANAAEAGAGGANAVEPSASGVNANAPADNSATDSDLQGESSQKSNTSTPLDAAGKVAMSAVLATTLAGALSQPPRRDLMTLPDPVPIIRVIEPPVVDVPADTDEEPDKRAERIKRLLKLLKFLVVALLLGAAVVFGALKGCASCSAGVLTHNDEVSASESSESNESSASDSGNAVQR